MPSWTELVNECDKLSPQARISFIIRNFDEQMLKISNLRDERNIIFYGSAFLQKPQFPSYGTQIMPEDINGFMSVMHTMNWDKGLTLILHTPGGVTTAAETIVEYLRSKFPENIEVIVPAYAMSAGTMISLASDRIIMGRQSQLGPIDPQMPTPQGYFSALAIIAQFERAKKDILDELKNAHIWAPILSSLGPALLVEAENAKGYSEQMVLKWLSKYMFRHFGDCAQEKSAKVVKHFSQSSEETMENRNHGRRIDVNEALSQELNVVRLEDIQALQEAVLTCYHLLTILFESSPSLKIIASSNGKKWIKNAQVNKP